jgi:hypothetical protein
MYLNLNYVEKLPLRDPKILVVTVAVMNIVAAVVAD